ncbi:MAG: lysylphosphatidylglycerol synthase domain-containing protein [Alphaproteobacteria bacterium]|nr:lysylphosphatidylglycerol synthase domain-containing protein [Alphaproteobacteria bacterium]
MSTAAKKTLKKLIGYSGILFFCLAAGMLWWQLRHYSFGDIMRALLGIPFVNLVAAAAACVAGYVTLALYDYLALKYVGAGGKVAWWKWMLAGMLGFAISNNAGHAVVSGGAIRYRLYTRWRIRGGDIVKIVTINGFTYFLGCAAIAVVGYFLIPSDIFNQSMGANVGLNTLFVCCLAALLAYFTITVVFRNKSVKIGQLQFEVPSTKMAFYQTLLGITDSVLAGLVLYFCLIPFVKIPFGTYIGLFVVAQTTGVFSQVPGGIGVFESVFLLALPADADKASIFGALLAYRIIYYVLPLIGVGGMFFVYERWLRVRMKRWLAEAKSKIPHISITKNKNTKK